MDTRNAPSADNLRRGKWVHIGSHWLYGNAEHRYLAREAGSDREGWLTTDQISSGRYDTSSVWASKDATHYAGSWVQIGSLRGVNPVSEAIAPAMSDAELGTRIGVGVAHAVGATYLGLDPQTTRAIGTLQQRGMDALFRK